MPMTYKFPLKMHVGAPSTAIVKEGQNVKRGECIANPEGCGAKIHSSITGKVTKLTENEILILAEDNQSTDYIKIKKCDKIEDTAYEAGIVGAGGAGFPTHIKLKTQMTDGYVIANCVECEPALHHNIEVLENNPQIVIKGLRYAMSAIGAPKGYIAVKAKNKNAIVSLKKALSTASDIEVKELRDMYPMGEERAMIHEIFGIWLNPDQLPFEAKCVVLNGETLANLTRAVEEGKPVIDKDVTIVGKLKGGNKSHVLLQVSVGTSVKHLIENAGGIDGEYGEIIIGGPYTGKSEDIENAVVTKTSGGAIVTISFPKYEGPIGLLVCACGADEARLRNIAEKMHSKVVGVATCKNVIQVRGLNKCLTPGDCPGQAEAILYLKKQGAKRVLIANCSDCTNTVMCVAPKLGIPVYHHTDHVFRTIDYPITRRLPMEKK
ncbi:proline reductase-associated electron transfer protein PrdC [Clostridium sp.]|uniref:proline reductase-associated electron transfer protein PrdC n=1 Tax=Clostridium sp. TaxID=1506 RepID=UPI001A40ACAE|nr:proline reductase-associated electron transfer protein PrdC [Clostridium sp.]MBK5242534.1 proline reductase-associated electron transfer protein PrdC [Clostridium sp.]